MSRNYTAIHYIQEQLKGFNPKFMNIMNPTLKQPGLCLNPSQ